MMMRLDKVTQPLLRRHMAAALLLAFLFSGFAEAQEDCRQPEPVCAVRASIFAISGPGGIGSATRLSATELVTTRHLIAGDKEVELFLESGERIAAATTPIALAGERPETGAPVCALSNAFGLGIGITCGVVSANRRSGIGFNRVEDFLQTDAALNPGSSGGALVDLDGRLVGLLSAIFTKDSDANIGVNFAVSTELLLKSVPDGLK
jgi:S1-C subfamily serine protease